MSIGATTGKEPDHLDDADMLSVEEMRGTMKDISAAHMTSVERATVSGVLDEMQVIKKMLAQTDEQNNRLVNLYQILKNEFDQFKQTQLAALTEKVNCGSTTPEDYGPYSQSGD